MQPPTEHRLVSYGPPDSTPADVCEACSDFDRGLLVPVSQCPPAAADAAQFYSYLNGDLLA